MRSWARRWMFKAKDMMTLPQRQITMPMKDAQPDDSGGESGVSDCLVQKIVGSKLRGREDVIIRGSSFVVENLGRRRGVE